MNYFKIVFLVLLPGIIMAQNNPEKEALKFNINDDGSHYFQVTFLNQTWLRFNESNPGTLIEGVAKNNSFDIGLRRTRIQMFGQITDKVFLYFQFGQNNFNAQYNINSNRKTASFFHDALCEYKLSKGNQLKLGAGLTIANGLSRFSQPSIGSIMTLDVPVFAQSTVDQTDEFSRKLSFYARGQIGKFDYRLVLSDPFPIMSSGTALPNISQNATFAQKGHELQQQGYLMYQFFEQESNTTPYMTGTYLGKKKIFNIAVGGIFQKNAMWKKESTSTDTIYQNMKHFSVESFLDMPVNKEKETMISAYLGFFNTDYGTNYLRYNGIMNPANGSSLNSSNSIVGQGPTYGNALPMFGTGQVIYSQFGYLLSKNLISHGKLMPYISGTFSKYNRLGNTWASTFNVGLNYLILGHKSKITVDYQNRPTYIVDQSIIKADKRKGCITLQYQIFF